MISDSRFAARIVFAEGKTNADGVLEIRNIAGANSGISAELIVDGNKVGNVSLEGDQKEQWFVFRLPPQTGDMVPDLILRDLFSEKQIALSELKGRVVFLDFWATWCGPCQAPLQHISEIMTRRSTDWAGKAVIVGVSIDDTAAAAMKHCKSRKWDNLVQGWCCQGSPGWNSTAVKEFVITGVPTAFLIDQAGRIVWRGHPAGFDVEARIDALIEKR